MDDRHLDERLRAIAGNVRVSRHAPLAPLTTFKVGGPADWLVDVSTEGELLAVLAAARDAGAAVTILGGGSNVLIGDRGIRGVVIRPRLTAIDQPAPGLVRAEAGVTINGLVRWTIARGLGSLEAWAGTPGTVGGAIAGNAHFGGRNIGDLVARVAVVTAGGGVSVLDRSGMAFGYDSSRITRTHEVVLWRNATAPRTGPLGDVATQEDTSDSQLIARWRSLARSVMSMPVVVATCSIGVRMRSSGEWMFAWARMVSTSSSTPSSSMSC